MTLLVIVLTGMFFCGMGIFALARPAALVRPFGIARASDRVASGPQALGEGAGGECPQRTP